MKKISLLFSLTVLFCIALYSCGGDDPLAPTVKVDIDSGSTITTTQKITLTFSKSMDKTTLTLGGTMAADSDGGAWSKDKLANDTLTISPTAKWDASNIGTLTVAAKDTDKKAITDQELSYPIKITFTNFKVASVVIGQPDFVSIAINQGGSAAANTIDRPYGNPAYLDGALFLPDYSNNRILKYNSVPTTNNKNANIVVGQADLVTTTNGNAANEMDGPEGAIIYKNKLLVLDYSNNRVTIFNSIPTANDASANVVVGQTAFGLSTSGCTSTTLNNPEGFYVVGGKLIVTDSSNNRVLIWNTIPTTNGKAADVVLGQADFTHCTANDANHDNVTDATSAAKTMYYPAGVWSDGTKLVIEDSSNNRVLIWNTFPTTSFKAADLVLGQGDFTHSTANDANQDNADDGVTSAKTMNFPYFGVYSNGAQLFVTDGSNNRVLIWNTFPTTSFKAADVVLGQGDFTHDTANDANQDNSDDGVGSAKGLNFPDGILLFGDKMVIADEGNNRYLIYQGQ